MSVVSMKQLLEAGVHFGHQTGAGTPKWLSTFSLSGTGYIIDLPKTVRKLEEAYMFIRDISTGRIGLVCRHQKQAQESIREEATAPARTMSTHAGWAEC